jgi:hypothetical protein
MSRILWASCVALSLALPCWADDTNEHLVKQERRDFYGAVARYNFSAIWRHDQQYQEFFDDTGNISRRVVDIPANETIGFIGSNYRRFYIRYNKVVRDSNDPYLYHVTGKTRVGEHINDFTGTLRIQKATLYKYSLYDYYANQDAAYLHPGEEPFQYGDVEAEVLFKESSGQRHAGVFMGLLRSSFHLIGALAYLVTTDETGDFVGETNNYLTTWTDAQGKQRKTCNWTQSDWIPGGEALLSRKDDRVAYVTETYYPYGWRSYGIRTNGYSSDEERAAWERANKAELAKWWLR